MQKIWDDPLRGKKDLEHSSEGPWRAATNSSKGVYTQKLGSWLPSPYR